MTTTKEPTQTKQSREPREPSVYGCEIMWGAAKAVEVQELVEAATGQACPCKRRIMCPLLPARGVTTMVGAGNAQGVGLPIA